MPEGVEEEVEERVDGDTFREDENYVAAQGDWWQVARDGGFVFFRRER